MNQNISFIKYFTLFAASVLAFSCREEPVGRQPADSIAPGPVSDVTCRATPGGAVFHYRLPADEDLLYVKAVYFREKETPSEAIASIYADSLIIEGFGDTAPREVSLHAVDRSGNASTPVVQTVTPLQPNIWHVGEALELVPDFGGIRARWHNRSREEFAIVVLRRDSASNEYVVFDRTYSTQEYGNFVIGDNKMEPVPGKYAVYAQDRWGHRTETRYYTLIPHFLTEFDKRLFRSAMLPNDCVIMPAYPITNLWDGTRGAFLAVDANIGVMPKSVTLDMGVLARVYRIQFIWRLDPNWIWRGGAPRRMKVYGCAVLDPTGNWDSWTEICDYVSVKPSGLPPGQNTQEDIDKDNAGELFEIDPDLPPMRYLRINVLESWAASQNYQLGEVTVYGDNR